MDGVRVGGQLGEVEVDLLTRHAAGPGLGVAAVAEVAVEGLLVLLVAGSDPLAAAVGDHREGVEVDARPDAAAFLDAPGQHDGVLPIHDGQSSVGRGLVDDGLGHVDDGLTVVFGHDCASAHVR